MVVMQRHRPHDMRHGTSRKLILRIAQQQRTSTVTGRNECGLIIRAANRSAAGDPTGRLRVLARTPSHSSRDRNASVTAFVSHLIAPAPRAAARRR
jgi:hypothetical protein